MAAAPLVFPPPPPPHPVLPCPSLPFSSFSKRREDRGARATTMATGRSYNRVVLQLPYMYELQSRFAPKRASVQQKAPEKFRVHRSHFRLALFYSPVWVKQGEVEFNYTESFYELMGSIFYRQEMGIWLSNRPLLEVLSVDHFPELVSIRGLPALAKSKRLTISKCPKLKQRR
uniref:Uncharacterized protein n=1 Tax=Aegilops tauschii TaxID=37682 RepID=M8BRB9_AEGTA